jgi:hypothetical protein
MARLGHGGQVHVVLERHRPIEVGPQRAEQTVVPAGQVEGEGDVAGGRVDQAGRAEHHPAHPLPWRVGRLAALDHGGVHDATGRRPRAWSPRPGQRTRR